MSIVSIIPPRYAKEVQEITEKQIDDLCEVFRITAMDEGDRRFLLKRCVMEFAQQVYRIRIDAEWRKELEAQKKAS